MTQMLVILSNDADGATIAKAISDNSGSLHGYLAPTVLVVDGDQTVHDALAQTAGVAAVMSDDDAKTATASTDVTQLDVGGAATWVGQKLGTNTSYEEPMVLAITGWMYGKSDAYATRKSDRPRDGEAWDMPGGCLPNDEPVANA